MPHSVTHVTGARPNFPKAAPVISALNALGISQRLVHTGQHYDDKMSGIFFEELDLPHPDINLGVGSGSHAAQTAQTMILLEQEFLANPPKLVVVYGDINSTVAAALVASKLHIPLAHVEAGLRSFDMQMPEEVNRIVTDQLSERLFVTSPEAIGHLAREGVSQERIEFVGNPMIDTLLKNLDKTSKGTRLTELDVPEKYLVATLHRPSNVDDQEASLRIISVLHQLADIHPIYLPLHPRGRASLLELGLDNHKDVNIIDPLGYLDFVCLMRYSAGVVTDSGGVQEETTILKVPCYTLRPNTERPITITSGTNLLVTTETVVELVREQATNPREFTATPPLWDGHAGERIAQGISIFLTSK
jgi:UDP-N-acetylglucosamine 2-epimerase (non-hydrolysing)